jgi:hypothetical protein
VTAAVTSEKEANEDYTGKPGLSVVIIGSDVTYSVVNSELTDSDLTLIAMWII